MNNKTYFIVSDIHGFYHELMEALDKVGYDKNNTEHILVVVGDIFDRGPDNLLVYKFLRGLPKDRRILIRGNHEDMFVELIGKSFPAYYDFQNKTVEAFCHLSGFKEDYLLFNVTNEISNIAKDYWAQIVEVVKMMKIDEWIKSDEWVEYFEIGDFILTHSFLPLRHGDYNPDWRTDAKEHEWKKAHWGNPLEQYRIGFFEKEEKKGKKLVFGHWHTSDIRLNVGEIATDRSIFDYKGFIALDGGVFRKSGKLFHPVNILVINNGKYTKHHMDNIPPDRVIFTSNVE
jgi:hypothetical protein